ncbi:tetratricopeptide repeat protein [Leptolyngbya sp. FACHB-261]|uniref:serine/threonine-protein kinase n=1 Tax=Leptolyngbya sp. FACHB-261 TaxID=2692806 RepID=UPI00168945D9|nr:serine/threonine-protein kinase [Leptolyngbya sp. FACHB-261]MBD2104536.1 tetratricopeptide repeat protein [Leptolyngbya sp. FACHB-261]
MTSPLRNFDPPPDPLLGTQIAGRYDLVRLLGQGGMGRVYLAQDSVLGGMLVALKTLTQTLPDDLTRRRFEREAQACALLSQRSLHVVRVSDYGFTADGLPFYVMEYLEGRTLREIMQPGPVALHRFLSLVRQICLGLRQVHEGLVIEGRHQNLVHRDLKPSNILVQEDASMGELVKVLDFGIAKFLGEQGTLSVQTQAFIGTLAYASPEQMEGRELDARSDIYSLGLIMYEMLSGTHPLRSNATSIPSNSDSFAHWYRVHNQEQPRSLKAIGGTAALPAAVNDLVMSCLAKQPADRPQTVDELLKALGQVNQSSSPDLGATIRVGSAPAASETASISRADTEVVAPAKLNEPQKPKAKAKTTTESGTKTSLTPAPTQPLRLPDRRLLWGGVGVGVLVLGFGLLSAFNSKPKAPITATATPVATDTAQAAPNADLQAKFRDSLIKAAEGDNAGAKADCEAVTAQDPESALGQTCASFLAVQAKQWQAAIDRANAALKLDPKQAVAYNNRGSAYYFQGKMGPALQDLNRAIQLNPSYAAAYNIRAAALQSQKKSREALQSCQKAIELSPRYLDAYNTCGNIQGSLGAWNAALGHYNRAIELGSQDPVAFANRGLIYNKLGDNQSARSDLQKALDLTPADNSELRNQLTSLLQRL